MLQNNEKFINLEPYYRKSWHKSKKYGRWCVAIFIFSLILTMIVAAGQRKEIPNPVLKKCHDKPISMQTALYREYFKRSGNKHPELMADAVLATKKPKLMAAVAVRGERNTPYTVKKGGYKKRHVGAFQVSERDWGFAGVTPLQQALKAEDILNELLVEHNGNLKKALNAYGGDKTKKVYAKNILSELENIP